MYVLYQRIFSSKKNQDLYTAGPAKYEAYFFSYGLRLGTRKNQDKDRDIFPCNLMLIHRIDFSRVCNVERDIKLEPFVWREMSHVFF